MFMLWLVCLVSSLPVQEVVPVGYPTCSIPPYAEPLHPEDVKAHLKVEIDAEDTVIAGYLAAARRQAEDYLGRQFVVATWQLLLDSFYDQDYRSRNDYRCGHAIDLPRGPVMAISSVTYVDTDGDTQTLAAADYQLDAIRGRLAPAYGVTWPTPRAQLNAVTITYVAGYLTPFTAVASTDVCTSSGRTPASGDRVRLTNSGGLLPLGLAPLTDYFVRDVSGSTFKLAATSGGSAINLLGAGAGTHFLGELPPTIRQAMLLLIGFDHQNREPAKGDMDRIHDLLRLAGTGEYP